MPFDNQFRLSANAFARPPESIEDAKSVIFISAEGTCTEPDYFHHLNSHLKRGCPFVLHVLHHDHDTKSDPRHVLALLEQCRDIRADGASLFVKSVADTAESLTEQAIQEFFDHPETFPEAKRIAVNSAIVKMGIDVDYYRYLRQIGNPKSAFADCFVLVVDRDRDNHSRETLVEIRDVCRKNNFDFCLSNPCFDLWLLLHLEVRLSTEVRQKLLANRHVSKDNTYSSKLVSDHAHHGKSIAEGKFEKTYLPKIRHALKRARRLAISEDDVIDNLGTRVPVLMDKVLRWL